LATVASTSRRPTQADFVRRRTVALGVVAGLLLVLAALLAGDSGSPFGAASAALTPAQQAKLPWKQRYVSGSAGPLDGRGLPSPPAQRAAVRRFYRLGLPIYCAGGRGNYAALTFDDGPSRLSPQFLRLLEEAGVQSTFFIIGENVAQDPQGVRRARDMGGVGNHTWTHANLARLGPRDLRDQLTSTTRALERAADERIDLMRPPYGARDAAVDRAVHRLGMLPVMWDVDTRDSAGAGSAEIAANAAAGMRPGSIILMHDTYDRSLAALPEVLKAARQRGIRLVSVPQLLALDPPSEAQVRAGGMGCSERRRFQQEEDATAMRLAGRPVVPGGGARSGA
jgi:peptidoglycan/xylan/chitin deacetylase (PgdA/CDA1 family)